MPKSLYEQDFQQWIEQTIQQLHHREFASLDIDHLIEELTDLGKSEKNALKSNLTILMAHLLKLMVQVDAPETMKLSWYSSIDEHRQRINTSLSDTPSLKQFLPDAIARAYLDARKLAIKEGKRATKGIQIPHETDYPIDCPFAIDQLLDEEFYGEE
ncbi:MAG: DUF29 domain-containing protein [Cyanobacteria bacterium RU_5_0]|nr:DUF29 domain-containing protein [Cyanobacteria bacterium RU_5_0]